MRFSREFEHDLPPAMARKTIDEAAESYRLRFDKYSPHLRWQAEDRFEFRFRAKGLEVHGGIELRAASIVVELEVPFVFLPLRSRALGIIERELRRWIDAAHQGRLAGP